MTRSDMERVQTYLRGLLGSDRIRVVPPAKPGLTVEVAVDDEVVGTLYRGPGGRRAVLCGAPDHS